MPSEYSTVKFLVTPERQDLLNRLDEFIEKKILPLQHADDNMRFFDHRREIARTDFTKGGLPAHDWEELLGKAQKLAEEAGFFKLAMAKEIGGGECGNLTMAIIREHFCSKGLVACEGLHCDIQNEFSIVGNMPVPLIILRQGTPAQKEHFLPRIMSGEYKFAFGLTEPDHGSDATHMDTRARREGDEWIINGEKAWNTGAHVATHELLIARTAGRNGDAKGLTAFLVPTSDPGFSVKQFMWTYNMPTDHAHVIFKNVRVPHSAILGKEGEGLSVLSMFVNENRIRQAASSLGTAVFCVKESVKYANDRKLFGKAISSNQAIQFPIVEFHSECEMLRMLIRDTAQKMDSMTREEVNIKLSDRVSMCNFRANRLATEAADWAIQVHGGMGYSRHKPFEHLFRHHRRYRITEGSDQIQKRNVAKHLFGFGRAQSKL